MFCRFFFMGIVVLVNSPFCGAWEGPAHMTVARIKQLLGGQSHEQRLGLPLRSLDELMLFQIYAEYQSLLHPAKLAERLGPNWLARLQWAYAQTRGIPEIDIIDSTTVYFANSRLHQSFAEVYQTMRQRAGTHRFPVNPDERMSVFRAQFVLELLTELQALDFASSNVAEAEDLLGYLNFESVELLWEAFVINPDVLSEAAVLGFRLAGLARVLGYPMSSHLRFALQSLFFDQLEHYLVLVDGPDYLPRADWNVGKGYDVASMIAKTAFMGELAQTRLSQSFHKDLWKLFWRINFGHLVWVQDTTDAMVTGLAALFIGAVVGIPLAFNPVGWELGVTYAGTLSAAGLAVFRLLEYHPHGGFQRWLRRVIVTSSKPYEARVSATGFDVRTAAAQYCAANVRN